MTGTVDIGAARVRLIVDANEFDAPIREGQNAVKAFGAVAEAAYDKQQKATRRAANALLDYVSQLQRMGTGAANFKSLDTAAAKMDELVRKASRMGVVDDVLKPAIGAWQKYAQAVMQAEAVQEDQQRGAATAIAAAKQAQLQAQITLYNRVEQAARDAAQAEAAQAAINTRTGVGSSTGMAARDQSALIAELQRQVQLEQQIEAEARDINSEVGRWKSQLDAIGKDYYDIQIAQARLRYGDGADPIVKQIEALRQANSTIHGTTVNAKQLQQAIRFLPAQFTDIGVSLASGMNPALVLFQQGGQIFDQFRLAGVGAGGALKEIGVRAMALVNPVTFAGVAMAALAAAAYKADAESSKLNQTLIATGNYAGTTVGQIGALAGELDRYSGVTVGSATAAATALAATGKLTGDSFREATAAIAIWSAASGEGVESVATKFASLEKDPVGAIKTLNSSMRFLTEEVYEQIKSLEQQGKHTEAVNLAVKTLADTMRNRAPEMEASLGNVEWALRKIKNMAREAADAIIEVFRNDAGNRVRQLQRNIEGMEDALATPRWRRGGVYGMDDEQLKKAIDRQKKMLVDAQKELATKAGPAAFDPEQKEAAKKLADERAAYLATADEAAQRKITINRLREEGKRLGLSTAQQDAAIARQIAAWDKADAKRGRRSGSGRRDGPDPTRSIKAWEQAELEALKGVQRETKWAYDDNALTVEAYYNKLNGFAKQERDLAVESAQRQIAALAGRKDASERIEALQENIRQAETAYANKKAENDRAEVLAIRDRERALQDYIKALDDANKQTQRDADLEVARIGMGSVRYQRMVAINDALRKRQELEDEINRKQANFELSAQEADKYRAALSRINGQINLMVDGWQRVDEAQSSFFLGAQGAWQDWVDQTRDVASQGRDIMTSALEGFTEAAAQALNGNLDQFKSFFENIHMEILRFIVRQQLTKWMESLGKSLSNVEGDGFLATLARGIGGLFGGASGSKDNGATALKSSAAALTGSAAALTSAAAALGASGAMSGIGGGVGEGGSSWAGWASTIMSLFSSNAKGGVYGGDGIAAYRNQIVSSPKMFRAYARGGVPNFGLMGERSGKPHEAIMPLTRLPGGDLGVRIVESSKRGPVSINQQFIVQGTPDRTTREQMAKQNGREISRATARM